jgi:hypothetical protein
VTLPTVPCASCVPAGQQDYMTGWAENVLGDTRATAGVRWSPLRAARRTVNIGLHLSASNDTMHTPIAPACRAADGGSACRRLRVLCL